MTKQEIQEHINELQKQLDKCPEVEPFTCKGKWVTYLEGTDERDRTQFHYWQTKEIAEKAYQLQLRHRKMLNFVSQHQELDEGEYYLYKSVYMTWGTSRNTTYFPDVVTMTKETADKMLEAISNGSLVIDYA